MPKTAGQQGRKDVASDKFVKPVPVLECLSAVIYLD